MHAQVQAKGKREGKSSVEQIKEDAGTSTYPTIQELKKERIIIRILNEETEYLNPTLHLPKALHYYRA